MVRDSNVFDFTLINDLHSIDSYAVLPWDFLRLSDTISSAYSSFDFNRRLLI